MDYTVNDYLSDFKYYLKYLKTNSSSCWKLDVEKEYNKYNDEVTKYNTVIESVPSNIVASIFAFKKAELFQIDETKKENIKIEL